MRLQVELAIEKLRRVAYWREKKRNQLPLKNPCLGGTHMIRSHEIRTVHRVRQVMDLYH